MLTDLAQYQELFLSTSKELISTMQSALKKLQKNTNDAKAISDFHRAAHSLKSQSLVMGFRQLGIVNRQLEGFFNRIQDKEIELTNKYMHLIEDVLSHIKQAVDDIDKSEHEVELEEDIKKLRKHTNIN